MRNRRFGNPLYRGKYIKGDDEARFWSYVNITDNCWLWEGNKNQDGYGQFGIRTDGKTVNNQAHRFCYELLVGKIESKLQLDHLCRVHNCVSPDHLEPVTQRENILRGWEYRPKKGLPTGVAMTPKGRYFSQKCINGISRYIGIFDTPEEAHKAYLNFTI